MKKRFKGFTLIELLAVIIILGIILLIALPMLLNVIEDARVGAYKASVKMIFKDIELLAVKEEFASIYVIDEDLNIVTGNINELGNKDYDKFTGTWEYDQSNKLINLYSVDNGEYKIDSVNNKTPDTEWSVVKSDTVTSFICGSDFVDDRDDNTYKTVEIGNQCWFAENLRYTTSECLSAAWTTSAPYDSCRINGGNGWDQDEVLYQWSTAMNGSATEGAQGMCPTGWHVSTDSEWKTLEMALGMSEAQADLINAWRGTNEGEKLKSTDPSWGGADTFGFNASPSGLSDASGTFSSVGSHGYFWTSSVSVDSAWRRGLYSNLPTIHRNISLQYLGLSVRCILGD